jgi:hypothetical protein
MSGVVRSIKNVTKGYSSVQVKVRNGMRFYTKIWLRMHPGDGELMACQQRRATKHGGLLGRICRRSLG